MTEISQLTCLLVDDDRFFLVALAGLLESLGVHRVIKTESAEHALTHLHSGEPIDLVITDLNMPRMDGVQLLRHLSSQNSKVGIILISGEDPRLLESVENLGMHQKLNVLGALQKPIQREAMESLLRKLLHVPPETPSGPGAMVFADELKEAIYNNQLTLNFQPQLSLQTGDLIGVEALCRWTHPSKGNIPPSVFIGIAEKHRLINKLTDYVFINAIEQAEKLLQIGLDTTMSVNFSAQSLCSLDLPEQLSRIVGQSVLSPRHLVIEITESLLADDTKVMLDILTRMRLRGFGLSIDDFGTGFSSLEQLQKIPFTELKIDRAFVHNASANKAGRAILESSVDLAQKLGIDCVAEGVEDEADFQLVKELGCGIVQGFYTAKPMSGEQLLEWAEQFKPQQLSGGR